MLSIYPGPLPEVISVCYPSVIMTGPTGFLRTVRFFAIFRNGAPIESFERDPVVLKGLGPGRRSKEEYEQKKNPGFFQGR